MDLYRIRKRMGLTQQDVEDATGIDTATLSLYENYLRLPTVKNAKKLAKLYGFNWTKLFEEGKTENDKTGIGVETPETA